MANFIEIIDSEGELRLINVNHISDIYSNIIYLDSVSEGEQIHIRCTHSYEEIKQKLLNTKCTIEL